jgi:hypothetical protein
VNDKSAVNTWLRTPWRAALILAACAALAPAPSLKAETPGVPKIAVFDFELADDSASSAAPGGHPADLAAMAEATSGAKKMLADSGKYLVIDAAGASAGRVTGALRDCNGCEAKIALQLGAQLSLLGAIVKVEQAAYAVEIQIRDAATGKGVFARRETFLGGPTEWSSGVRSMLRRELLTPR